MSAMRGWFLLALSCAECVRAVDATESGVHQKVVVCLASSPVTASARCAGDRRDAVLVTGLETRVLHGLQHSAADADWAHAFRVSVVPKNDTNGSLQPQKLPSVIGRYSINGDALQFVPQFGFGSGTSYSIRVDVAALSKLAGVVAAAGEIVVDTFSISRALRAPSTRVVAVYPRADVLPENLLRFYVEFSAPMRVGEALEHIHLRDSSGREVHNVFLKVGQELWDSSGTRLTVLLDPGRVKRGIRTNLEMGAPLIAGRRYSLVVDRDWQDGGGAELVSGLSLPFTADEADRKSPSVEGWTLVEPVAGTRLPLEVRFGEAMDHAQALRMILILDSAGRAVSGTADMAQSDSAFRFTPDRPWRTQQYEVRAQPELEDVAGNNLRRVFDRELGDQTDAGRHPGFRRAFRPARRASN